MELYFHFYQVSSIPCNLELVSSCENSRWVNGRISLNLLDICHLFIKVRIRRGKMYAIWGIVQ